MDYLKFKEVMDSERKIEEKMSLKIDKNDKVDKIEKTLEIETEKKKIIKEILKKDTKINLSVKYILTNLIIISMVRENQKLRFHRKDKNTLEIDKSYFQCFTRKYNDINRNKIISFIENLYKQTYENIEKTKDPQIAYKLLVKMEQSLSGLKKLRLTYKGDSIIESRIDRLEDEVNTKKENIRRKKWKSKKIGN